MSNLPALNEGDYEAIEAAVMETARGRWFLKAYAQRNRQTDTTIVLKALDRIEATLRGEQDAQHSDRMRFDLIDMATAISRTKAEIAAIKPDAGHHGKIGDATSELDAIVQTTELATSDILAAAEQIQEIAWTLREQGVDPNVCDTLDAKATEIYTACSFQDLTGQRTQKVIQVMRYLEGRINAMIDIWGLDGAMAAEAAESETVRKDAELLNGPALPGQGLNQLDVDMVIGPVEFASSHERPGSLTISTELHGYEPEVETDAGSDFFWSGKARDFTPVSKALPRATPLPPQPPVAQPRTLSRNDALASIDQLSYEEKLALFT